MLRITDKKYRKLKCVLRLQLTFSLDMKNPVFRTKKDDFNFNIAYLVKIPKVLTF
jgi:hypothetical protein